MPVAAEVAGMISENDKTLETVDNIAISQPTSVASNRKTSSSKYTDSSIDELIKSLSSETENRRARQVFEWESARRRSGIVWVN